MRTKPRLEITAHYANYTSEIIGDFADGPRGRKEANQSIDKAYEQSRYLETFTDKRNQLLERITVERVFPEGLVQKLIRVPDRELDAYPQTRLEADFDEIARARQFLYPSRGLRPLTRFEETFDRRDDKYAKYREAGSIFWRTTKLKELDQRASELESINKRDRLALVVSAQAAKRAVQRADEDGETFLSNHHSLQTAEHITWQRPSNAEFYTKAPYWLTSVDGRDHPVHDAKDRRLMAVIPIDARLAAYEREHAAASETATLAERPQQEHASVQQVQEKRKAYGRAM